MSFYRINVFRHAFRNFSSKPNPRQAELMARSLPKKQPIKDVTDIVIVASGKGGVGKSTSSVNLAVSLSLKGKRVGLLDADIFGPTVPLMMNLKEAPLVDENNLMIPPINYGVKCLSMGLLVDTGPVVWRGPLVMSALQRLLKGAVWGPLDILIVDTPPGTGDVHLSLAQNVPISGVILVSTPQIAALEVMKKGAQMYQTLNAPIIGLLENMSHTVCKNCNSKVDLFENATKKYANEMNIQILESLPMESGVSESSDSGVPLSLKSPDSEFAKSYQRLSNYLIEFLDKNKEK